MLVEMVITKCVVLLRFANQVSMPMINSLPDCRPLVVPLRMSGRSHLLQHVQRRMRPHSTRRRPLHLPASPSLLRITHSSQRPADQRGVAEDEVMKGEDGVVEGGSVDGRVLESNGQRYSCQSERSQRPRSWD